MNVSAKVNRMLKGNCEILDPLANNNPKVLVSKTAEKLSKTRTKPKLTGNPHEFVDNKEMISTHPKNKQRKSADDFIGENLSTATKVKRHKSADADELNDVEEILPIVAKKKKRKKKTKTQELTENKIVVDPKEEFTHGLNTFIKHRLSTLEKKEFEIPSSGIHVMQLPQDKILECFQERMPKCLQVLKKNVKHPGCPLVLFMIGSAIRSVDLKRKFHVLSEEVPIAKLFAKHMKIKDQVAFLEKNVIKLAVGTPKRISELLDLDALSLRSLRYIMLDWHWRDSKLRRMIDMQEVKREVFEIFYKHLGQKVIEDNVRIILL